MKNHFLFWATGQDHPGFVAAITKILFEHRCNLEDSSMMRLGSEFAMFVIFTSENILKEKDFSSLKRGTDLNLGLKKLSPALARFTKPQRNLYMVRVHGQDRPGLVYRVSECLEKHKFNITDLSTHRTNSGKKAGYILLLEGELPRPNLAKRLESELKKLSAKLKTHVSFEPISAASL